MHLHLPHLPHTRGRLNIYLFDADWRAATKEIEYHPNDAKHWSTRPGFFDGEHSHESHVLPIHIACSLHAPLDVIKAIVEAYPECLSVKESSFKRLPIHVACQFANTPDVIQYMSREYVAGTLEPDILGRLPLHYACSNGASLDVVTSLLSTCPASALYADFNGWLPLHVAVHFGASIEVIRELVRVCPTAVYMKTKKNSTALSLAKKISTKNKVEVIAVLNSAVTVGKYDANQFSVVRRTVPNAA